MTVSSQISAETILHSKVPLSQQKSRKFLIEKHNDNLMMTTVEVFAKIFTSEKLNDKNNLQLMKHFVAHSVPPLK